MSERVNIYTRQRVQKPEHQEHKQLNLKMGHRSKWFSKDEMEMAEKH